MSVESNFLESTIKLFAYYKSLGERTFDQLSTEEVLWKPNEASNSIGLIVHHLSGNMLSRWTDFLTTDGEKPWRDREAEFAQAYSSKEEMLVAWQKGWDCLLNALNSLKPEDLSRIVYIRNEGQTVVEVIHRQLAHYSSHVGQIMYIGKQLKGESWKSLSIPKGASSEFNAAKFAAEKSRKHFTDGLR
ncbi:MAG TPA: DUF1572 family protein [Cyclobacteriaceae bacterium]|nr:DUF1572 family protein [Cyclobacteriaceae bacterium]